MTTQALSGIRVLEIAGGIAGAYAAKLFADMGADVTRLEPAHGDPLAARRLDADEPATEGLYWHYLNAGKAIGQPSGIYDLLVIGEDSHAPENIPAPRIATLAISWFGSHGPYAKWKGSDLVCQAIGGMTHPCGPAEGPPYFQGEHQATQIGGLAAYTAGVAALIGGAPPEPQSFDISILESIIVMSEYQMSNKFAEGFELPRVAINRYIPTCPLSIHRCKEGWIGITPLTPAQWQAFCDMLDLPELRDDPDLVPSRTRYPFADRIEQAVDTRFPGKTALEWAALAREAKVPMVWVPDALGIIEHPIFNARQSLASFEAEGKTYRVPRTPFRLEETPPRLNLSEAARQAPQPDPLPAAVDPTAPLAGIRVADFSMGWAGPLATRILADLGAEVIKIEAGRYPDWWRSVDWSPEAIARGQYEESRHFNFVARAKKSVSLDLTMAEGLALAKDLTRHCDIVVENQAAGVMPRLGLGWEQLSEGRSDLIYLSMSAFGTGNAWSDTRAYGSVLEQGSGLPSFCGREGDPPVMGHIAYGDPIGGVYGAASLLTALYHRARTGRGQWINNTQIEAMLPFTAHSVLIRQATGREPKRLGNRHSHMAPHGVFATMGEDRWVALSVPNDAAWAGLCKLMGRRDWLADETLATAEGRRARQDELEAGIAAWAIHQPRDMIAAALQEAGVAAGPVLHLDEVDTNFHFQARGFFYDTARQHVGPHYQASLPFKRNGQRYPLRGLAPFLGGDSEQVLTEILKVSPTRYADLLAKTIVSLKPTQLRGT